MNESHIAEELLQKAQNDAYQLSVVLLIAAMEHDEAHYTLAYQKIVSVMANSSESSGFKAWLWGRVLVAAQFMQKLSAASHAHQQVQNELKTAKQDAFSAWAYAYLAIDQIFQHDDTGYEEALNQSLKIIAILPKTDSDIGNLRWAQVMVLYACAMKSDQENFNLVCDQLGKSPSSIIQHLQEIKIDDWQAWALGIVRFAAAKMRDQALMEDCRAPLESALAQSKNIGDKQLARLYNDLAESCSISPGETRKF